MICKYSPPTPISVAWSSTGNFWSLFFRAIYWKQSLFNLAHFKPTCKQQIYRKNVQTNDTQCGRIWQNAMELMCRWCSLLWSLEVASLSPSGLWFSILTTFTVCIWTTRQNCLRDVRNYRQRIGGKNRGGKGEPRDHEPSWQLEVKKCYSRR